jgi:hypothetical protein
VHFFGFIKPIPVLYCIIFKSIAFFKIKKCLEKEKVGFGSFAKYIIMKKKIICNICDAIISFNGSPSAINKHLKYFHKYDTETGSTAIEMNEDER